MCCGRLYSKSFFFFLHSNTPRRDHQNGETIRRLEGAVAQTIRLLRRIANRHSGMKEGNMIRLVPAFVMSRITYMAPYLKWQVAEKTKLDGLIRKAYKQAIGLPITTNTNALLNLGLHNTLDELIEAQNIAQYERLSESTTGRNILGISAGNRVSRSTRYLF